MISSLSFYAFFTFFTGSVNCFFLHALSNHILFGYPAHFAILPPGRSSILQLLIRLAFIPI